MVWLLAGVVILLAGAGVSLAAGWSSRAASVAGAVTATMGGGAALVSSLSVLISGNTQSFCYVWSWPLGKGNLELDALSAVFASVIAIVTILAAVYGVEYLREHGRKHNLGVSWFFFNLLTASMLVVVIARNGVLFLAAWEFMSLCSFFLVMLDDQREEVRRAGWLYLVAMHLGTAFLLMLFLLMGKGGDSLNFEQLSIGGTAGGVLFVLAVIGFGTKAGFVPMHVWLPEAHPAAPSHVSAVMSGVMIKTGIYGLLRTLTLLGTPAAWWGWTLLGIGVSSGVIGVLYALSQHDLKRLLAYHSVENIGIIIMGLGIGLLGIHYGHPGMTALGLTGCLLHVMNHAVFKSLLFLGAGSVLQSTGTGDIDCLGGLLKRMPVTGATFLVGAAAICGLPPLNGFVSEFLIYLGAVAGLSGQFCIRPAWALMGVFAIGGLALIGGLAAACFTKAFGVVFLGEPRQEKASCAREVRRAMRWPMLALASLCLVIGLTAPVWPLVMRPAVVSLAPGDMQNAVGASLSHATKPLAGIVMGTSVLVSVLVLLLYVRARLLSGRCVEQSATWDCGYAAPAPRMQYTGSSFARPLMLLFSFFLRTRDTIHAPCGLFPERASLHTDTPDLFRRWVFSPLFVAVARLAMRLRWLQEGRIQIYVLYIALTILVLLIWKLG